MFARPFIISSNAIPCRRFRRLLSGKPPAEHAVISTFDLFSLGGKSVFFLTQPPLTLCDQSVPRLLTRSAR